MRTLIQKAGDRLRIGISGNPSLFACIVALIGIALLYRIRLTGALFTESARPFDFNPADHSLLFLTRHLGSDLGMIGVLLLAGGIITFLVNHAPFDRARGIIRGFGFGCGLCIVLAITAVHGIHHHLLFSVQTGFGFSIIREALLGASAGGIAKMVRITDVLFLILPAVFFWAIARAAGNKKTAIAMAGFVCAVLMLAASAIGAVLPETTPVARELQRNPAVFLAADLVSSLGARDELKKPQGGSHQTMGMAFNSPLYKNQTQSPKLVPPTSQRWNVVLIVLESVGSRYPFDTAGGAPLPMPFLHKLKDQCWHLARHHTTSNISSRAVFSLLSGVYDFFKTETFCIQPNASVPSLYSFLGPAYDGFLVTPACIDWYFPTAFVRNSGIPELYHYENLSFKIKEDINPAGHYVARNEIDTVTFFNERVNRAREPFMGVYISFTAHYPYFDYGPDYQARPNNGTLINRYYNNLRLLDNCVQRIYDNLKASGALDRTIVLIVGDHGQAFGQHQPNNFMHFRYSYTENLEAPAFLYQPRLFSPRTINYPTSHVDILPTLLDGMNIRYNPNLFQGESLFQIKPRRKYIFFYGQEHAYSSLSMDDIKLQFFPNSRECRTFNLKSDPEEKRPGSCTAFQNQFDATTGFATTHSRLLEQYNSAILNDVPFMGESHPRTYRPGSAKKSLHANKTQSIPTKRL